MQPVATDEPFVNEPIDVAGLPRLPEDRFEPLDPRFLRIRLTGNAVAAAIVIAVAGVLALTVPDSSGMPRWVPLLAGAGLLVLIGLIAWLQTLEVRRLGYLVRDQDFSFRSGVISRSVVTVPFARIQHVSIDRGPLARAYGLATLQMRTAGSGGLTVPGMSHETAQRLKALVADRAAAVADDELGEQAPIGATPDGPSPGPDIGTAPQPAPPPAGQPVVTAPPPVGQPVVAPPPPPAGASPPAPGAPPPAPGASPPAPSPAADVPPPPAPSPAAEVPPPAGTPPPAVRPSVERPADPPDPADRTP
ncbi:MAG: PH domain-containing protein [Actinomycetota bacterium]